MNANHRRVTGVVLAVIAAVLAAGCGGSGGSAGSGGSGAGGELRGYPRKPVEFITAGDPGGGLDIFARSIDQALKRSGVFTKTMTIINRGGGGGNPVMAIGRQRRGTAYTLLGNSNRVYLNPLIGTTDLRVGKDFVPIAQLMTEYLVFAVRADSPYKTAKDVMAALKRDPKSVTFGVGTVPSDDQLSILRAADASGVDLTKLKIVAFSSGGDLMTQLLGGRVDVISTGLSEALEQYKNGDIRILAISSPERLGGAAKDIPTWKEQGIDVVVEHWRGVFGPADMPKQAVDYWIDIFGKMVKTPEWKEILKRNEWSPLFRAGDDFRRTLDQESATAERLLGQVGLVKK